MNQDKLYTKRSSFFSYCMAFFTYVVDTPTQNHKRTVYYENRNIFLIFCNSQRTANTSLLWWAVSAVFYDNQSVFPHSAIGSQRTVDNKYKSAFFWSICSVVRTYKSIVIADCQFYSIDVISMVNSPLWQFDQRSVSRFNQTVTKIRQMLKPFFKYLFEVPGSCK